MWLNESINQGVRVGWPGRSIASAGNTSRSLSAARSLGMLVACRGLVLGGLAGRVLIVDVCLPQRNTCLFKHVLQLRQRIFYGLPH